MEHYTCYDGKLMNLPAWQRPVLVDLDGLEIPKTVPLLTLHDEKNGIKDNVKAKKTDIGTLVFECELGPGSIGADFGIVVDVLEQELIKNKTITANNKNFIADEFGFHVVTKAYLREISIIHKDNDSIFNYEKRSDNVNHPAHYTSHPSGIECIDITKHYDFCVGNAIKYLWRAGLKQEQGKTNIAKEIEDLEKAIWYINKKIEMLKDSSIGIEKEATNEKRRV